MTDPTPPQPRTRRQWAILIAVIVLGIALLALLYAPLQDFGAEIYRAVFGD